jgi:ACS family D-galactonate transporter-like MFS transporter
VPKNQGNEAGSAVQADLTDASGARIGGAQRPRGNVRWIVVALLFVGTSIVYIDRANLSAAAPQIQAEFGLSATQLGLVLSGFFWTYAVFQLISGWFVDRVGVRASFTLAALLWSVFTAMTALGRGFSSIFGLRLLLGIGESPAYPSNAKAVREWMPKQERGLATGFYDSGSRVGTALSLPIVVLLISLVGWRGSFVLTGLLGVVWGIVWWLFYRTPQQHSRVSEEELRYIEAGQEKVQEAQAAATRSRWVDLLKYRAVWGMVLGNFCIAYVIYWFVTWFPTYLVQGRGFDLPKLGLFGAIPALVAVPTGWLGGFAADRLVRAGWSVTRARKTLIIGGLLLSTCILLSLFTSSSGMAVALLSVSYGSLTFANASVWLLPGELAPATNQVASLAGIMNFAGSAAGITTSIVTGALLDLTGGSFVAPLLLAGGFIVLGVLAYGLVIGRVEPIRLRTGAES